MQIASENEEEKMIPKKYYVELFKQYMELSIDARVNYFKGLITGLISAGSMSYLIYLIHG